jgi:hypothetical protein
MTMMTTQTQRQFLGLNEVDKLMVRIQSINPYFADIRFAIEYKRMAPNHIIEKPTDSTRF